MNPDTVQEKVNPFTPRANLLAKVTLLGIVVMLGFLTCFAYAYTRSAYATGVGVEVPQPIPFSHAHHVSGLGIDCRYCHDQAETSFFAGMPSTNTCMNCHWQLWTDAELLAPLRESWRTGRAIAWRRVHDVPDFAYFDHSIHLHKGIGCSTCHGRVDRMPLVHKAETLHMAWCLDCHRDPIPNLRPQEALYLMDWDPERLSADQRHALAAKYAIERPRPLTDCSTCHR